MADKDLPAIVIDNGTGIMKGGKAGDDAPSSCYPKTMPEGGRKNWVGPDALEFPDPIVLYRPIEHGVVRNWDEMEKIWYQMFYRELKVAPEEHPVLLTEVPLNPRTMKEKTTQIMFEVFNCPAMYIAITGVLALYAAGKVTGIVLDCGDGVTHTVPIYEGYALPHATLRLDLGGRDLTDYLIKILGERNYRFGTTMERDAVRRLKEESCYVSPEFTNELKEYGQTTNWDKEFKLPDGKNITIRDERFRAAEPLFVPSLVGLEQEGVHQLLHYSVQKCDMDLRRTLYDTIFLAGGSTLFDGMLERLQDELRPLVPSTLKLNISSRPERAYSQWIGGSILASLSTFQSMWTSKQEYDESGPTVIRRPHF